MGNNKKQSFFQKKFKEIVLLGASGIVLAIIGLSKHISNIAPEEYSPEWLQGLSNEELHTEREKIRVLFCKSGSNPNEAIQLQKILYRFDNELTRRRPQTSSGPTIHREHGWYLPNDD